MTRQPTPNAVRMASERLMAIANLIERPPVDDVELTQSAAMELASAIRTIVAALDSCASDRAGHVLVPAVATREMVDAADACTDAYSAYAAMVEVARVR